MKSEPDAEIGQKRVFFNGLTIGSHLSSLLPKSQRAQVPRSRQRDLLLARKRRKVFEPEWEYRTSPTGKMSRTYNWSLIAGLILLFTVAPGAQARLERPKNVVLIGWDGADRRHVKRSLARGELPHLKKLSSGGALVAIDILRATDTKAGWTQILTGYEPETTRVFNNCRYEPIPKGYTVFERLEKFFGPDSFVTVAVVGKKGSLGYAPPKRLPVAEKKKRKGKGLGYCKWRIIKDNGKKYHLVPGEPYHYTRQSMDVFINGLGENKRVGRAALRLLSKYRSYPFFFFVHFAEVDEKGHTYGEDSKEYNNALRSADQWTGSIIKKLRELGLYNKTLVYVTADHGFDQGLNIHGDAPYVFLATNDPMVMRRGQRTDIAPTILLRFGLDLGRIEPPLDGHPLTKPYNAPIW